MDVLVRVVALALLFILVGPPLFLVAVPYVTVVVLVVMTAARTVVHGYAHTVMWAAIGICELVVTVPSRFHTGLAKSYRDAASDFNYANALHALVGYAYTGCLALGIVCAAATPFVTAYVVLYDGAATDAEDETCPQCGRGGAEQ